MRPTFADFDAVGVATNNLLKRFSPIKETPFIQSIQQDKEDMANHFRNMAHDSFPLLPGISKNEILVEKAAIHGKMEVANRNRKNGQGKLLRFMVFFVILTIAITLAYLLMTFVLVKNNSSLAYSEIGIPGSTVNEITTTSVNRNGTDRSQKKEKEKQKVVLFWTNYFGDNWKSHFTEFGGDTLPGSDDPLSNASCLFTTDRSKLSESSAVVFHGRNFDFNDLPKTRKDSQRWVFYLMESPYNSGFDNKRWAAATKVGFNWTMTYTIKSDIFCPYCHIDEIQLLPNRTNEEKVMREIKTKAQNWATNFANRSREALWFVSHCDTKSKREELVEELRKNGIKVDSFGGCSGKRPDPIINQIGPEAFYSKYTFYLAFENSLCDDYVS